jgi:hypothetical protein
MIAVPLGVVVGSTLYWVVSQRLFVIASVYQMKGHADTFDTFIYRHAVGALVVCGLATYVYASQRLASQRLAALRVVQLDRVNVERRVVESRLAALQARVEPSFLLRALAQVESLYEPIRSLQMACLTRSRLTCVPRSPKSAIRHPRWEGKCSWRMPSWIFSDVDQGIS